MKEKELANRQILVAVTGSIAAYKAVVLIRLLRDAGASVRVVMTRNASAFVAPLTFQAVSGHPVASRHLDGDTEASMGHIQLARWADMIVIAPASANTLARISLGVADDLLADICLATQAPVLLAPAMNHAMWSNPATRDNVARLKQRGFRIHGPATGEQACGECGAGRMSEPENLLAEITGYFAVSGVLSGRRVIVTAGPTLEPIDPVRYIGNRSSGKMGYALAASARLVGAEVILITGPVSLEAPAGVSVVRVETASQMYDAVMGASEGCDIFIGVAAVADYRPVAPRSQKIKKGHAALSLELVRTKDILATVAGLNPAPFTVGFAAETESLKENAGAKLIDKGADMIAANAVNDRLGFDRDENALEVIWPGGGVSLSLAPKPEIARELIEIIAKRFHERDTT